MRGPPVCLRDLTAEERSAVETLARSRTAPARRVERARIVLRASRGETPPAIPAALGVSAETVRGRIRRFNADGLAAFEDHHRSGRPATYSPDEVAAVIAPPLSAKSYPGRDLVRPQPPPARRARQEIDYGRRGKGYVFGAFCPATGAALTRPYPGRGATHWVAFLEAVEDWEAVAQATAYWNAPRHPFVWGRRRRHRPRRQPGSALLPKAA